MLLPPLLSSTGCFVSTSSTHRFKLTKAVAILVFIDNGLICTWHLTTSKHVLLSPFFQTDLHDDAGVFGDCSISWTLKCIVTTEQQTYMCLVQTCTDLLCCKDIFNLLINTLCADIVKCLTAMTSCNKWYLRTNVYFFLFNFKTFVAAKWWIKYLFCLPVNAISLVYDKL